MISEVLRVRLGCRRVATPAQTRNRELLRSAALVVPRLPYTHDTECRVRSGAPGAEGRRAEGPSLKALKALKAPEWVTACHWRAGPAAASRPLAATGLRGFDSDSPVIYLFRNNAL